MSIFGKSGGMSSVMLLAMMSGGLGGLNGGISALLPSGADYKLQAKERNAELQRDAVAVVAFVVDAIAYVRGSVNLEVTSSIVNTGTVTTEQLSRVAEAIGNVIAQNADRGRAIDLFRGGLSWLAGKVVRWFGESDDSMNMTAMFLDQMKAQAQLGQMTAASANGQLLAQRLPMPAPMPGFGGGYGAPMAGGRMVGPPAGGMGRPALAAPGGGGGMRSAPVFRSQGLANDFVLFEDGTWGHV